MNRTMRARKPAVESLEGRLAPSGGGGSYPVPGPPHDNGSWEPKPIGNSSTRPTIPTGPTGPVRWQGDH